MSLFYVDQDNKLRLTEPKSRTLIFALEELQKLQEELASLKHIIIQAEELLRITRENRDLRR